VLRRPGRVAIAAMVATLVAIAALALGTGVPNALLAGAVAGAGAAVLAGRGATADADRRAIALRAATSDARAARDAAEAERDRLGTLVAELGDAVLFADRDEVVRLANPAARRLLGGDELVGRRLVEVVRDHEILDAIAAARSGHETVAQVERDGGRRVLRVSAKPLAAGEILLAIQDLSSMRRLETQRRDFVANVSHELRTPLASLKAMVETLEAGAIGDPAAARDFLSRIHHEVDGLSQLVNELLSLSRIESGEERLDAVAVAPQHLLTQAAQRMQPLADRAGIRLSVDAPSDLPLVSADPGQIGRVLTNLVHNALKFTPQGGSVTLAAAQEGPTVALSVADTGMGIDEEELGRVFERFYKTDRARASGGTGIGLAIVKHIVQAHGGSIVATSNGAGSGSTFTFTLPRAV
jgi:two-component system phosphate regulon sensor histidine kinase PhoR